MMHAAGHAQGAPQGCPAKGIHLAEALALEVAVQPREQDVLGVHVGGPGAEVEQIRQELRLVNCDDLEARVIVARVAPELCQAPRRVAVLRACAPTTRLGAGNPACTWPGHCLQHMLKF